MIVLAAKFTAKAGRRNEILDLAGTVAGPSRAEAGNITYNYYTQPGTENFLFFEEWADQEALDVHLKTPHFAAFIKPLMELVEAPPKIRVYEVGATREL
jgi:quinol monooxygenase YgiN